MSIEELVKAGSIRPFRATQDEVDRAVEIARRDLALAGRMFGESDEVELVTEQEAKELLKREREFLSYVESKLKE
ncbi:MAG: hypothetical protein AAGB97_05140 [Dehalococcoidia bacterium]|nr:hypothetical protein [Chloroflexota bacterium]MBT9161792.1 hypothetical protein [Chloroflexota bacterium]